MLDAVSDSVEEHVDNVKFIRKSETLLSTRQSPNRLRKLNTFWSLALEPARAVPWIGLLLNWGNIIQVLRRKSFARS